LENKCPDAFLIIKIEEENDYPHYKVITIEALYLKRRLDATIRKRTV